MRSGQAVVVMPPSISGQVLDLQLRRWMSRGVVSQLAQDHEMLVTVLTAIDAPIPEEGFAALRFLGQAGEHSRGWIAAADPVHYQARLRDVRLRSLPLDEISKSDIQEIFLSLNESFAGNSEASFICLGAQGYLHTTAPMQLPSVSAQIADGHVPDKFTPSGSEAKAYHQMLGEIQMLLHEHPVNLRREQAGMPAINSLWLWGGGVVHKPEASSIPDLYTADDLFAGYWAAAQGESRPWLSFANCLDLSPHGFVAVLDDHSVTESQQFAYDFVNLLSRGSMRRLFVVFRDGLKIQMDRHDRFKVWRGLSPLLVRPDNDETGIEEIS